MNPHTHVVNMNTKTSASLSATQDSLEASWLEEEEEGGGDDAFLAQHRHLARLPLSGGGSASVEQSGSVTVAAGISNPNPETDGHASSASAELSSLALNLSSQAEYNNELLEYIHHLEGQFSASQARVTEQERQLVSLQHVAQEQQLRAEDLSRQLSTSSELFQDLSQRHGEQGSEAAVTFEQNEELRVQVAELTQQKQLLEEARQTSADQSLQLEARLAELQRRRLVSDDDCADSLATMTITLEKTTADLERERERLYEAQTSASLLKDENIQLTRRVEHFLRVGEEESEQRDRGARQARELQLRVTALQDQVTEVTAERDHLQQGVSVARARLQAAEAAEKEAVQAAEQTDLLWRELQEVSKQQQSELQELRAQLRLADEKTAGLEKRLQTSVDREQHMENVLKEELERKTEAMRVKLEDQQSQRNRAQLRLEEVQDRHDAAQLASATRIQELSHTLQSTTEQLNDSAEALKKQKADHASHELQLESIVQDLRDQLRKALHAEQGHLAEKERELQALRVQLAGRGERYGATLSGLHDAVHAITQEAVTLKDELAYVHRQHAKLLTILQQMAVPPTNTNVLSGSSGSSGAGNPAQRPLHEYCLELQRTLAAVIRKVTVTRDQHQAAVRLGDERAQQMQQLSFEKEELRGQLTLAEETLTGARSKLVRMQSHSEEAESQARTALEAGQAERDKLTARLDKSENRVTDMIRQVTTLQADLRRVQAEASAAHNEAEARHTQLTNKTVKIAAEREDAREKEKQADARNSKLQNQLMAADAQSAKQQSDYRKLKRIALALKEELSRVASGSQQQLQAMSQAMEQYRVQLEHKQELIAALQQQRAALTAGNEQLQGLVNELRDTREAPSSGSSSSSGGAHMHALRYPTAALGHVSSSGATCSRQALSGLAQLVNSRPDSLANSSSGRGRPPPPPGLAVVHGTDIGAGVFNANLRHLTASLSDDKTTHTDTADSGRERENLPSSNSLEKGFQLPAHPREARGWEWERSGQSEPAVGSLTDDGGYRDRDRGRDSADDIFRLTSPSKERHSPSPGHSHQQWGEL